MGDLTACRLGSFVAIDTVFDPPVERTAVCTPLHTDGHLRLVCLDRLHLAPLLHLQRKCLPAHAAHIHVVWPQALPPQLPAMVDPLALVRRDPYH